MLQRTTDEPRNENALKRLGKQMLWNNVKIAIRNIRKNRLFAFINIAGLALGMTIFVFGMLRSFGTSRLMMSFSRTVKESMLSAVTPRRNSISVSKE
jgi:hypothetical protein